MNARERMLSRAYDELHATSSTILYEEDRLGAGSSVDSPCDEYDHEPARLAAVLRQTNGDARMAVIRVFSLDDDVHRTEQLPARVGKAWRELSAKISQG